MLLMSVKRPSRCWLRIKDEMLSLQAYRSWFWRLYFQPLEGCTFFIPEGCCIANFSYSRPLRLQSFVIQSALTRERMDLLRRKGIRVVSSGSCCTGTSSIIHFIYSYFTGFEGDSLLWKIKVL
ncbi:hypothetical protein Cni_G22058 [Canna indica]|uniref:Uncharacterized protein n=1 Tax=Canna indica TaxID=4628 RepID=A0AAQ3QJ91_9LILI|nr:hypothetical protein Cni_G22058 [Canna indica]